MTTATKDGLIDISGADMVKLAQEAYALSEPKGLGFFHAEPGGLSEDDARALVEQSSYDNIALSLDYVKGRAVKLVVWRDGDKLTMRDSWYDHSPGQLRELLTRIGKTPSDNGAV